MEELIAAYIVGMIITGLILSCEDNLPLMRTTLILWLWPFFVPTAIIKYLE